jgi:hypothetical protein
VFRRAALLAVHGIAMKNAAAVGDIPPMIE